MLSRAQQCWQWRKTRHYQLSWLERWAMEAESLYHLSGQERMRCESESGGVAHCGSLSVSWIVSGSNHQGHRYYTSCLQYQNLIKIKSESGGCSSVSWIVSGSTNHQGHTYHISWIEWEKGECKIQSENNVCKKWFKWQGQIDGGMTRQNRSLGRQRQTFDCSPRQNGSNTLARTLHAHGTHIHLIWGGIKTQLFFCLWSKKAETPPFCLPQFFLIRIFWIGQDPPPPFGEKYAKDSQFFWYNPPFLAKYAKKSHTFW